jgi:predicted anti-sigma-YlaC factor YlaD
MKDNSANSDPGNSDLTNSDPHERARLMIALSGTEEFHNAEPRSAERSWLAAHLETCQPCREFRENARATIRSLRGIPVAASGRLVSTTQMRVRQRAAELQRQRERLWVVCVCCVAVTLSAAVTTLLLWRGFAWMGEQTWLSAPVWEGGFIVFYLMPSVFAGILLLSRGTFLADHSGTYPE